MPYCDKHRLGTCCGEKHDVPFSRLHAKPKALYKAVVDATTDDERAAAVAALEEYEGSNGSCWACQKSAYKDKEKDKARRARKPGNLCTDPFNKGCRNPDPSHKKQPCPDCKEEKKRRAAAPT